MMNYFEKSQQAGNTSTKPTGLAVAHSSCIDGLSSHTHGYCLLMEESNWWWLASKGRVVTLALEAKACPLNKTLFPECLLKYHILYTFIRRRIYLQEVVMETCSKKILCCTLMPSLLSLVKYKPLWLSTTCHKLIPNDCCRSLNTPLFDAHCIRMGNQALFSWRMTISTIFQQRRGLILAKRIARIMASFISKHVLVRDPLNNSSISLTEKAPTANVVVHQNLFHMLKATYPGRICNTFTLWEIEQPDILRGLQCPGIWFPGEINIMFSWLLNSVRFACITAEYHNTTWATACEFQNQMPKACSRCILDVSICLAVYSKQKCRFQHCALNVSWSNHG